MFQFAGFPPRAYVFGPRRRGCSPAGFPHSDTHGSLPVCGSPWLFAACRVLRRLPVPRHPPCAFLCLTLPFVRLAWRLRAPSHTRGMLPCPPARPRGPCRACARVPARPVLPALVSFMTRAQQTAGNASAVVLVFGIRFSRCVLPFRRPCGPLPGWA